MPGSSDEIPKVLTADAVHASDVVITMGCGDTCPVFPGKRYPDWTLADPAGRTVEEIRPIRDDIERRVRALIEDPGLTSAGTVAGVRRSGWAPSPAGVSFGEWAER
jgi:arsenate reductase (thioredoxin)